MRDRRDLEHAGEGGWLWLDRRRTTRFKIDGQGLVEAAERDNKPAVWVSCDDVETLPDDAPHVFWARPGTSLKTVMLAMHRSQTSPVALFDDQSRFVGRSGSGMCFRPCCGVRLRPSPFLGSEGHAPRIKPVRAGPPHPLRYRPA
jgi:hypothetical protein